MPEPSARLEHHNRAPSRWSPSLSGLVRVRTPRILPRLGVLTMVAVAAASCDADERAVTGLPKTRNAGVASAAAQSTVVLTPTGDTFLTLNDVSQATNDSLNVYTWPSNMIANAIVMKFDLTDIPAGVTISSATLNLYLFSSDPSGDPTYTVTAHAIVNKNPAVASATGYTYDGVNGWTPNACCYDGIPLAQADIGPAVDSRSVDKTPGFKQWDVTSIVQDWFASPGTNLGLLVNSDPSKLADRWRFFSSSEHPDVSQRPYLEVVYTVASMPGTVTDLAVTSTTDNSATLSFTEVDDGTGQPADYIMRYATPPISWGSATDVAQGTCQVPMAGSAIGASRTCTVEGLVPSTAYEFQVVAYRGTLNQDAVFGELSNIAAGTTGAPPPPPPTGVIFESNWATELGGSDNAVRDGGRWSWYAEFNGADPTVQLLSVVSGGPDARNALRVQQRGEVFAANIEKDDFIPLSTDYYVRYYMRNDDTSPSGDHVVTVETFNYPNLTYMRKYSDTGSWEFVISMYGCGEHYPLNHWGPWQRWPLTLAAPAQMSSGQWYRFEYHIDFVDATQIQVHPRVYDATGTLLFDDDDFRQQDWTGSAPDDRTLASYYAAGGSFCVDPTYMNDFGMGNNGQAGAQDTGLSWYFAAVQIRNDTWPGP